MFKVMSWISKYYPGFVSFTLKFYFYLWGLPRFLVYAIVSHIYHIERSFAIITLASCSLFLLFVHVFSFVVYLWLLQRFICLDFLIENPPRVGCHANSPYHVVAYIMQIMIVGVLYNCLFDCHCIENCFDNCSFMNFLSTEICDTSPACSGLCCCG